MNRDSTIKRLQEIRPKLTEMGVESIAIFGSVARDEAVEDSDLDMLVTFDETSFDKYMHLLVYLEELFGCKIDLATPKMLHPLIKPFIEQDLLYVA